MNLEEIEKLIVPILFMAVWVLGKVFGKRRSDAPEGNEDVASPEHPNDRTRRIQEEVLKKIEQRRRATAPNVPDTDLSPVPSKSFPRIDREPLKPSLLHEPQTVSDESADSAIPMAQELQHVQQLRFQNEALRRTSGSGAPSSSAPFSQMVDGSSLSWESVIDLEDPLAARKAMVYYEILGPPVGQRSFHPGW